MEIRRFNFVGEKTVQWDAETQGYILRAINPSVEECLLGKFVLYSDHLEVIKALENANPLTRIEKLEKALDLFYEGKCPDCLQKVEGWQTPFGSFAPEAWATLKEHNIDPTSGHKSDCQRNRKAFQ